MNADRNIQGPPVFASSLVRKQGVILVPSSSIQTTGYPVTPPALEIKVPGSMVYRRLHVAVAPKAWSPSANTPFEVLVEFLSQGQPVSQLSFYYGQDVTQFWPTQTWIELRNNQMGFMPPFVMQRQVNFATYGEILDPLDMHRTNGQTSVPENSLQWCFVDPVNANDGATLIVTSPIAWISDADTVRLRIVPMNLPWINNTDGLTDAQLYTNFIACLAVHSTSIPTH